MAFVYDIYKILLLVNLNAPFASIFISGASFLSFKVTSIGYLTNYPGLIRSDIFIVNIRFIKICNVSQTLGNLGKFNIVFEIIEINCAMELSSYGHRP